MYVTALFWKSLNLMSNILNKEKLSTSSWPLQMYWTKNTPEIVHDSLFDGKSLGKLGCLLKSGCLLFRSNFPYIPGFAVPCLDIGLLLIFIYEIFRQWYFGIKSLFIKLC